MNLSGELSYVKKTIEMMFQITLVHRRLDS
jgi:hypothetical protein